MARETLPAVDAFVLHNVFSAAECASLCAAAEQLSYTFWHEEETQQKRDFRNAYTVRGGPRSLRVYPTENQCERE